MAGINLLDQLRPTKASRSGEDVGPSLTAPPKQFFKFSFKSDPGDDVKLLVRMLLTACFFYGAYFAYQKYTEKEVAKVQTEFDKVDADLKKEIARKKRLKGIGEEMQGYQVRVDELKSKLAAVSQKDTNRAYLVKALEYVATEMPKEIWFDRIEGDRGDQAKVTPNMSFSGYALNAQAVSEFILKLNLSVYFPEAATLQRMELVADSPSANVKTTDGRKIPPNSRKFLVISKLGGE